MEPCETPIQDSRRPIKTDNPQCLGLKFKQNSSLRFVVNRRLFVIKMEDCVVNAVKPD